MIVLPESATSDAQHLQIVKKHSEYLLLQPGFLLDKYVTI